MVELRVYDVSRRGAVAVERLGMADAILRRSKLESAGYVTLILPVGAVDRARAA